MRPSPAELTIVLACFAAAAEAFAPAPMLGSRSASKMALSKMAPKMSLETSVVEQVGQTLAGVVAIDGGTIGLEVSFGAFLAVILGLFIPVCATSLAATRTPAQAASPLPHSRRATRCVRAPTAHCAQVVFLVTLYIQSEAQGTATTFRFPDSTGGRRFDD